MAPIIKCDAQSRGCSRTTAAGDEMDKTGPEMSILAPKSTRAGAGVAGPDRLRQTAVWPSALGRFCMEDAVRQPVMLASGASSLIEASDLFLRL